MKWLFLVAIGTLAEGALAEKAPRDFDCEIRKLAVDYANAIQPFRPRAAFEELVDALNLEDGLPGGETQCRSARVPDGVPQEFNPKFELPSDQVSVHLDAENGSDGNEGSQEKPFRTVNRAMQAVRSLMKDREGQRGKFGIVFREGRYFMNETLQLQSADSDLIFQNYNGEEVWLSGAKHVDTNVHQWKKHESKEHVWVLDLAGLEIDDVPGLRINGQRAVRARFPNGCESDEPLPSGYKCKGYQKSERVVHPEDGFGTNLVSTWVRPPPPGMNQENWREIFIENPVRNVGKSYNNYQIGVGGTCHVYTPPAGYWCGNRCFGGAPKPPRCIVRFPLGVHVDSKLPNAPYENLGSAVVHAWRPGHWASWQFEVDGKKSNETTFIFERGGFQGGRGEDRGEAFFIENVEEELDAENEFFFDEKSKMLMYFSKEQPKAGNVEIPQLKTLFNVSGSQENPISRVRWLGLRFRDTRYTYMDEHTMVSGGDWGLGLRAVLQLRGVEDISIDSCVFEEIDGSAIILKGYSRRTLIQNNDFHRLGSNIIALLGETEEPDLPSEWGFGWNGTAGNQPRGTVIRNNIGYRCGMFEKQSAFLFQGKSMESSIQNNIFFHGPRAGINLNDGFGGANVLEGNLLFTSVLETGDHGPFNSWDRQPYAHSRNEKDGTYIMEKKKFDELRSNFFIGNFYGQESVDNDDGSQGFDTHHNVLVYGQNGMKIDFNGHSNYQHHNLYAFIGEQVAALGRDIQFPDQIPKVYNNTAIMSRSRSYVTYQCACKQHNSCPLLQYNKIHTPDGTEGETISCNMTLQEMQKQGYDKGSTLEPWPSTQEIIKQAKGLLGLKDFHLEEELMTK